MDPFWLLKITTDPYTLAHIHIDCLDGRCPELQIFISEPVLDSYEYQ